MALFDKSSLLLVKSDLKFRGTKEIQLPATKTLPKSIKISKIKNPVLRNDFLFNPIKWDGARIMKSHPNRATTVNLWSPETLKHISELVKEWKGFNDSLYSFVKLSKTIDMIKFAWIIKAVKGRGDGREIGGKGGADGQETGDKGGTDGNAAGSGVDSNDAAAKGGAARGRGEAGSRRGQAAGGGGQSAGGGGLRVEFVFAFSLSAGP